MKMFKSIDEKLSDIGFVKEEENQFGARYYRDNSPFGEQIVCLLNKKSGEHMLQSYDPNLFDSKNIGCTSVGLTYTELKLFAKKMKRLGLKS